MHVPVLAREVLSKMREVPIPVNYFLDGTFGRGGHTRLIMDAFVGVKVVALDRDHQALDYGMKHFNREVQEGRIHFIHGNFADIEKHQGEIFHFVKGDLFSGILLDLGVSSPQLDEAERGFSFYKEGPLDMRMNSEQRLRASDIVNEWSEGKLVELFRSLGEVRSPQKVVQAIIQRRKKKKFESTLQLAHLVESIWGWRKRGQHPATQFFLALRLAVNGELDCVERGIPCLIERLAEGGRLFVITFHSLEDRIVKRIFRSSQSQGILICKKVIQAQWSEKQKNPRSRSAKLRVFQKGRANGSQRYK